MSRDLDSVLEHLERHGWMLLAGVEAWTLTTHISGDAIHGSWWGHDAGPRIYEISIRLGEHRDVESFRLVDKKVTFVHRRLWPAVVAVGSSRDPWQLDMVRPPDRELLGRVDQEGQFSTHKQVIGGMRGRDLGAAGLRLETALLLHGHQEHTDEGAHGKILESWSHWAERRSVDDGDEGPTAARDRLGEAYREGTGGQDPIGHLPWLPAPRRGR